MRRRIADRINGDQKAKEGNLSRRADGKLDTVAEDMRKAVGQRCTGVEKDFLERTVLLDGFTYLRRLHLAYRHENRLLSISYNLEWSCEVETDAYFHEVGDCAFALEAKGGLRVKGLEWVCRNGELSAEEQRAYLDRLSNPLILDRVRTLDLHSLAVSHRDGSGTWQIHFGTMIGSATWLLIPPVMQVIRIQDAEYLRLAELVDLLADAGINN